MGNIFSGGEVVEIGIQIEINGRDFYNKLVEQSKDEKGKKLFKYLAGEEEKHIKAFQGILNTVQKYGPKDSYPGEYFAYMNSLASEHIFTRKGQGAEIAKNVKDDKEAVDLGIKFEEESIAFYEGMKKVVREGEAKIIDGLILQEQEHLKKLSELKDILN